MQYNFDKNIILTSRNPDAFLNIELENPGEFYLLPDISTNDISTGQLFINAFDASLYYSSFGPSDKYTLKLSTTDDVSIATFHLNAITLDDFDVSLNINIYDSSSLNNIVETKYVNVYNRQEAIKQDKINTFTTSNLQVNGDTSYLILRTNPKFTGNIKLIADTSNNVYLDTFKVSDILSNKKYRKQKISTNSLLADDIRRVFSDLPLGELYKIGEDSKLDISTPKTNYKDQYFMRYNYGAYTFTDKLYENEIAMLSPLWINNKLPDYFVVFKLPGTHNTETYNNVSAIPDMADKYIKNSQVIESWSLKDNSPLGNYLRTHLDDLSEIRSPVFLSLSGPESDDPDPNTWYGIAVDKGIITGRGETPYFFDRKSHNITNLSAFVSEGFERNNLLCPNLLNLEFIFNDKHGSTYDMNRYFGFYLSENKLYDIIYYKEDPADETENVQILQNDNKDISTFLQSPIFNQTTGGIIDEYKNRIFSINSPEGIQRINSKYDVNGVNYSMIEKWVNKPGANIFSAPIIEKTVNPFISFRIQKLLETGEHLRIINKTENKIWEIYGISSDYVNSGESWDYVSTYEPTGNYPQVYRTAFSISGDINDQIKAIENAFTLFNSYENSPFKTSIRKSDGLSIILNDGENSDDYMFQRITSNIPGDPFDPSSSITGQASPSDILFYDFLTPTDVSILDYDASYGAIDFEFYGKRESIFIDFVSQGNNHFYSIDKSYIDVFEKYMYYYSLNIEKYKLIQEFNINDYTSNYVTDPLSLSDKIFIQTTDSLAINNGFWNAFSSYTLSVSLMGINPVKDIDYTIYDVSLGGKKTFNQSGVGFKSGQWYKREDDVQTYETVINPTVTYNVEKGGVYEILSGQGTITKDTSTSTFNIGAGDDSLKFNTFFGTINITAITYVTLSKVTMDGSANFYSYKDGASEEDINDYYLDPSINTSLRYPLISPYVTKWKLLGDNVRGNPLRLVLDSSIFESSNDSNFIPTETNFVDELSYPVFSYLEPGDRAWESYIYYDLYDVVEHIENGTTKRSTIRDLMFEYPNIDIFTKYIYYNNLDNTKTRSSLIYYNDFKTSLDVILNGMKLSLYLKSFATIFFDIRNWNKYRFSFISSPSFNRDHNNPLEVIINENTKTVLLIWYQGSYDLNYNRRYSNYTKPKSLLENDNTASWKNGWLRDSSLYSFIKAPYILDTTGPTIFSVNKYDNNDDYGSADSTYIYQINRHTSPSIYSMINSFREGVISNASLTNLNPGIYNEYFYSSLRDKYIQYNYLSNTNSYEFDITNNRTYLYNHIDNYYKDKTCDYNEFKDILNYNRVFYYIIRDEFVYSNNSFNAPPMHMTINEPRTYKGVYSDSSIQMYNGWFSPVFKDILKFSINEDPSIINTFDRDFTLCNTAIRKYNNIEQFWYNKVTSEITAADISINNAINFQNQFNPFSSMWDNNYYVLSNYDASGNIITSNINGFNSSGEERSFFGSKILKLPDKLTLNNWASADTELIERENSYVLQYNLTSNIIKFFKNTESFTDNWLFIDSLPANKTNLIDKYIKNTVLNYYNLNSDKLNLKIWNKPYQSGDRVLSFDLNNNYNEILDKNIEGTLKYTNQSFIYEIVLPKTPNYSYFVEFDVYRK